MNLPDGLLTPPIAHRGLWRPGEAPENSLTAFEMACQDGFGIELDVRLSADGEAMVFHDDTLERMTAVHGFIWDAPSAELNALPLLDGPETIPTLEQALELVAGRSMLLVEIKAAVDGGGALEARVARLLDRYRGPVAVISFDAPALAWFAVHRPDLPRGLDALGMSDAEVAETPDAPALFAEACELARPHFLVLEKQSVRGAITRKLRAQGLPVIAWTVRSADEAGAVAEQCDNFIFEGFTA